MRATHSAPEVREGSRVAAMGNQYARGHKHLPETLAKMRGNQNALNYKPTPQGIAKMSASQKRRFANPANHPRWLGGISREPYAWTFNDELKEEVRRRDGYKCQLCGVPQAECKTSLPVHHIDYDKKNSDPANLVALCNSCNAKVNANREHWTGFFQAMALRRDIAMLSDSGKRIG